jgi:hypothetical protein
MATMSDEMGVKVMFACQGHVWHVSQLSNGAWQAESTKGSIKSVASSDTLDDLWDLVRMVHLKIGMQSTTTEGVSNEAAPAVR